jgi:hypothetical protein
MLSFIWASFGLEDAALEHSYPALRQAQLFQTLGLNLIVSINRITLGIWLLPGKRGEDPYQGFLQTYLDINIVF